MYSAVTDLHYCADVPKENAMIMVVLLYMPGV